MNKNAIIISLLSIGYAIALTFIIFSATNNDLGNLYLLLPIILTPAMTIFIKSDVEDNDFWLLLSIFVISFGIVSCIAMPLTLWSLGTITISGLGYGLGSIITLFIFISIAAIVYVKYNDDSF